MSGSLQSINQIYITFCQNIIKSLLCNRHEPTLPQFLRDVTKGWQRVNPDYTISVITVDSIEEYLTQRPPHIFTVMSPEEKMDWIRLATLAEHGGFFIEPSMIITGSLRFIHSKQQDWKSEGVLFFMDKFIEDPSHLVFESFFIAAGNNT